MLRRFFVDARRIWAQWYITPAKQGKPIPLRRKFGFCSDFSVRVASPKEPGGREAKQGMIPLLITAQGMTKKNEDVVGVC